MPVQPILYLIRHGEKDKDSTGEDLNGLSALGVSRAQQLVQVFGPRSPYNICCILAQHPKESGKRIRQFETVKPLADSKPGVVFNYGIDRDDIDGVVEFVKHYLKHYESGHGGNVLICWEHKQLNDIARAIIKSGSVGEGGSDVPEYPGDRFDIIWTMCSPYSKVDETTSEHCTPQDDDYKAEGGWNYMTDS